MCMRTVGARRLLQFFKNHTETLQAFSHEMYILWSRISFFQRQRHKIIKIIIVPQLFEERGRGEHSIRLSVHPYSRTFENP